MTPRSLPLPTPEKVALAQEDRACLSRRRLATWTQIEQTVYADEEGQRRDRVISTGDRGEL